MQKKHVLIIRLQTLHAYIIPGPSSTRQTLRRSDKFFVQPGLISTGTFRSGAFSTPIGLQRRLPGSSAKKAASVALGLRFSLPVTHHCSFSTSHEPEDCSRSGRDEQRGILVRRPAAAENGCSCRSRWGRRIGADSSCCTLGCVKGNNALVTARFL